MENLNTANPPSLCHNIWAYLSWESLKLKKNKLCLTLCFSKLLSHKTPVQSIIFNTGPKCHL